MDYSKFSNQTLAKIAQGQPVDYSSLTDDELQEIAASAPPEEEKENIGSKALQTAKDAVTGAGDTLGISQQVGGAAQALPDLIQGAAHELVPGMVGPSPTQQNEELQKQGFSGVGPTSPEELYKQGTQDVQKDQEAALERSPTAYRAGEAGGLGLSALATAGLAPEVVSGAKLAEAAPTGLKTLAKMGAGAVNTAPVAGLYSGLNSKGALVAGTPEEQQQLGQDVETGVKFGGALGSAAPLVGDLGKAGLAKFGETDAGKALVEAFKMGKRGVDLSKQESQLGSLSAPESLANAVSLQESRAAEQLVNGINAVDDHLGERVGATIDAATDQGINVQAGPELAKKIEGLSSLSDIDIGEGGLEVSPDLQGQGGLQSFSDMAKKLVTEGLDPKELQQFRNQLSKFGQKLYSKDQVMASKIFSVSNDLTGLLKENVPGYQNAAERLNQFRSSIPETILSKDNPQDITNLRVSGTRNVDTK